MYSKFAEYKSTSSIEIDKKGKETSSKEIVCCDPPKNPKKPKERKTQRIGSRNGINGEMVKGAIKRRWGRKAEVETKINFEVGVRILNCIQTIFPKVMRRQLIAVSANPWSCNIGSRKRDGSMSIRWVAEISREVRVEKEFKDKSLKQNSIQKIQ